MPKLLTSKKIMLAGCSGILLFGGTALIAARPDLSLLEQRFFHYIYDLPNSLRPILLAVTQLGSGWMIMLFVMVAWFKGQRRAAYSLATTGCITAVCVELAKLLIGRPRPVHFFPDILHREIFVRGLGFPSGHTAVATAMSLALLPYLPKRYWVIAPLIITGVGLSRIYLGVHAPLDIIGGFGLGLAIASCVRLLFGRQNHQSS